MSRVTWKGAISFGLLHALAGLYPASQKDDIDFDWLHRELLKQVGYKRVIKATHTTMHVVSLSWIKETAAMAELRAYH